MHPGRIPESIESLDGNCGVASVWLVCHHANLVVEPQSLIQLCGHDTEVGTFTIALAVALNELGLPVSFHSDADPAINDAEIGYYERAKLHGIPLCSAQGICDIAKSLADGKQVISFFDAADGEGHFSPIEAIDQCDVRFECSNEPALSHQEFDARRRAAGICRQTIVIG